MNRVSAAAPLSIVSLIIITLTLMVLPVFRGKLLKK
jgi:hypothetical protein